MLTSADDIKYCYRVSINFPIGDFFLPNFHIFEGEGGFPIFLENILKEAGIDTVTFSAHSARGASTSGVKSKGLSMAHICKSVGWSGCQTFARHYNKPIQEEDFSSCLLRASVTETVRTLETLVETVSHDHGTYT